MGVVAEQQPHLHVPAPPPKARHRGRRSGRGPHRVQGDVGAADLALEVRRDVPDNRRVDHQVSAEGRSEAPAFRTDVDRRDPGAEGLRDHHRGEADAAAAVHGDPLVR